MDDGRSAVARAASIHLLGDASTANANSALPRAGALTARLRGLIAQRKLFADRATSPFRSERPIRQPIKRMKNIFAPAALLALSALISLAADTGPKRDILGLHLEMTKEEAKRRLEEIGTFEREERKQQEIWQVRDPSFSHVIMGLSKEGKLRYVTAVAREDEEAKRVPYTAVGNIKTARQAGDPEIKNFSYEWDLPASNDQPATVVNARGRDPKFLSTYSLKRVGDAPQE